MNFLKYRHLYFSFSALLVAAALASIALFGLKLGIDFTGGSILQATYEESRPPISEIRGNLEELDLGSFTLQEAGERGILLRARDIDPATHQQVLGVLGEGVTEERFESIGPVIGEELRNSTLLMLGLSALAIILYIALAFRRVTEPLHSWQYSVAAFLPLVHDVLIPAGVFAVLGRSSGVEITIPIVVGLLTVFGYSVNNTVVTFDRIRENILRREGADFAGTVNKSLSQTFSRNINTSLTTLLVLGFLYALGGATLQYFALALIIGIVAGTYSSLLLGPSFLVFWARRRG